MIFCTLILLEKSFVTKSLSDRGQKIIIVSRSFHANIIIEICLTPSGSLLFKIKTNLQKLYSIPDAIICGVCAVTEMHSCLKSELSLD